MITEADVQSLEQFFAKADIPAVMKLNDATTCTDVPAYVRQTLKNLRQPNISEAALRPRFDDMFTIKQLLEQGAQ